MGRKTLKTFVSDNFPLEELDCQYFDIYRDYRPSTDIKSGKKVCSFDYPCELRQWFREVIEPYMPINNLKFQIRLILDDRKEHKE